MKHIITEYAVGKRKVSRQLFDELYEAHQDLLDRYAEAKHFIDRVDNFRCWMLTFVSLDAGRKQIDTRLRELTATVKA